MCQRGRNASGKESVYPGSRPPVKLVVLTGSVFLLGATFLYLEAKMGKDGVLEAVRWPASPASFPDFCLDPHHQTPIRWAIVILIRGIQARV